MTTIQEVKEDFELKMHIKLLVFNMFYMAASRPGNKGCDGRAVKGRLGLPIIAKCRDCMSNAEKMAGNSRNSLVKVTEQQADMEMK